MSGELATLWEWRATLDAGVSLTTGAEWRGHRIRYREHDELRDLLSEAASEIASDIGMALASLGTSCIGGTVAVYCDGVKGSSGDAD